jgi:hypothetical protein
MRSRPSIIRCPTKLHFAVGAFRNDTLSPTLPVILIEGRVSMLVSITLAISVMVLMSLFVLSTPPNAQR